MNIVTIDFDIIMHRSINLYNDLVDDEDTISVILQENNEAHFIPNPDLFLYNYLTNYVAKCFKKLPKDHIFFIDDHDEVTELFNTKFANDLDKFNIFNIDFHHDIAYDENDFSENIEEADCGNWVKYLFDKYPNNFKQYIWIKAKESLNFDRPMSFSKKIITYNIDKYNLDALLKSTDFLFLCKSEPWVPLEEQQLYELWKDLFA